MVTATGRAWLAAVLLAVAGCGNGGSAVETRDRTAEEAEAGAAAASDASTRGERGAAAEARPALTASRRETVDAKITRLFERNGADFGASTPQDYLRKIEAFTARPPAGTERVERPNGDLLLYQASTNTFAVLSRDGAPRTMFKPREGAAYWAEQKAAAPDFGRRQPSSED